MIVGSNLAAISYVKAVQVAKAQRIHVHIELTMIQLIHLYFWATYWRNFASRFRRHCCIQQVCASSNNVRVCPVSLVLRISIGISVHFSLFFFYYPIKLLYLLYYFRCGSKQSGIYLSGVAPDGLMGLGLGNISVPSFLSKAGFSRNSFSLCLKEDTGRIFFGDQGIPSQHTTPFLPFDDIKYAICVLWLLTPLPFWGCSWTTYLMFIICLYWRIPSFSSITLNPWLLLDIVPT